MVVGGSEPVVRSLDFANGGALWAPLDLAAYADRDLVVTMELGYVDPANASSFEKLAFATEHLGSLVHRLEVQLVVQLARILAQEGRLVGVYIIMIRATLGREAGMHVVADRLHAPDADVLRQRMVELIG